MFDIDRSELFPVPEERLANARDRFLRTMRHIGSVETASLAAPFRRRGRRLLPGFRSVLELREEAPDAAERLAEVILTFDEGIDRRLAALARTLPDHHFASIRDVITSRGYRRVHTAALGAGALAMWSFDGSSSEERWHHGMATGILTSLALGAESDERDRAFATGLLHDLGRLALDESSNRARRAYAGALLDRDAPYVLDAAGCRVASELGLPAWLRETITPCELSASGTGLLETVSGAACEVATELGYPRGGASRYAAEAESLRLVRRSLDAYGGPSWLHARIESMTVAARGDLVAVLAAA